MAVKTSISIPDHVQNMVSWISSKYRENQDDENGDDEAEYNKKRITLLGFSFHCQT